MEIWEVSLCFLCFPFAQRKALLMARSAENSKLDYIAEEIVEYGNQRIERVKKQKKTGFDKSGAVKHKVSSG